MVQRLNQVVLSRYFHDSLIACMALAAIAASVVLSPSPEAVFLLGFKLPATCTFKAMTGWGCFGCGLTRSFAYMGDAAVISAFKMHPVGPVLYGLILAQLPYRAYVLAKRFGQGRL